jgi:hypothetical protein
MLNKVVYIVNKLALKDFLFWGINNLFIPHRKHYLSVRVEVFTAVTMKNGVFWDVTLCGSCKNRRFGGT